ncbi:MAG: carbohydrate-binding domain-containing protein [Lacipirellulaceae bacterium]
MRSRRRLAPPRQRSLRIETLEGRAMLAATINVLAAGLTGTEDVALEVNGVQVRRWDNVQGDFGARVFQTLSYTHPTDLTADQVGVRFLGGSTSAADLRVDGVAINGVNFESESNRTWSSGTWSVAAGASLPRHAQSEVLHSANGAFFYSATAGSTVEVRAAGATGSETMQLFVGNTLARTWTNVGGSYANRTFESFAYSSPTKIDPTQVRVAFTNDGTTAAGADRNLRVDGVVIDGRRFESEASSTFSTGTFFGSGIVPSFPSDERLQGNGYFEYSAFGQTGGPASGSRAIVWAAGATGGETMELRVATAPATSWTSIGGNYNLRQFVPRSYVHGQTIALANLRVAFTNDGTTAGGADRNLRVDAVVLDGVRYEAEAQSTYSTGTWRPNFGVQPGFTQSEQLQANGFFQFGADPSQTGTLALGATQYSVNEGAGFVDVEFVRTGGTLGAVSIDYTTVNGTAIAGQDFVASSGVVVFREGESRKTVRVAVTNDSASEGNEAFNVAADRVIGGAFLGAPRTSTVTIVDDEQPSVGTGIGLRGKYFAGRTLTDLLLARTDATVNFNWATGSPSPRVPADNFSVRWTGQVQPLFSETYTFEATTDDGVRVWVNGQQIINDWVDRAPTASTATIALQAGVKYEIRVEYYENGGGALAQLRWSSPSQTKEVIPTSQLYSEAVVSEEGQFTARTVLSGLDQPTAIDFAQVSGSTLMYIAQKDGRVRLAVNGVLQSGDFLDYRTPVNNVRDRGLLGLAVHPNFAQNPYVYVLYTYDPPETQGQAGLAAPDNFGNRGSRLTRVTADASNGYRTIVAGSEVVLMGTNSTWENISRPDRDSTEDLSLAPSGLQPNGTFIRDILITDSQSHTIGALDFGPDGTLYVTNGDGTSYGRVDPRTVRTQQLDNLSGKVLRIDPITGRGLSDNPFFNGDLDADRSKVFNYGVRNSFRMAVDPETGHPVVGDVGWTAWEELNSGRGQNFGWPFYEGGAGNGSQGGSGVNRRTGGYQDLPEAQAFYSAGGAAATPAWSRSHAAGGVAIVMGDFYTGTRYPVEYQGAAFFTDYGDPTIRAVQLDANGQLQQSLVVSGSVGTVVEMSMGPDGYMYYVDIAGSIGRFEYTAPQAALASSDEGDVFVPTLDFEPFVGPRPDLWLDSFAGLVRRAPALVAVFEPQPAFALLVDAPSEDVAETVHPAAAVQSFPVAASSVGVSQHRPVLRPAPRAALTPTEGATADEALLLLVAAGVSPSVGLAAVGLAEPADSVELNAEDASLDEAFATLGSR